MAQAKKSNKKKRVNAKKKKSFDYNKLFIITGASLVVLILIIIIIIKVSKGLECSSTNPYDKGVKQINNMTFNFKGNNLNTVSVEKTITVDKEYESNARKYLEIIDESLKESYKTKGIDYNSKIEGNKLVIKLIYSDKKNYVLNDVDIMINDENVSVNVMTQDNNNTRISVDLSKNNTKSNIKKMVESKRYICN